MPIQYSELVSGQLFLSKPGACFNSSFDLSSLNYLFAVSISKAVIGTANSLSPIPRKPPNDTTTYATSPVLVSSIISFTSPRFSPL
ncbi:hypothetical protein FTS_0806 [Francisella tularensis subsp. holarctica FSC200]|nr:hypothetical protein FTH_0808 [Francisella tularensis subsp. holarctica OSU18]AFT92662.1 hypothetical protein FTS_0806 [Francisella tularensis subsp. holarctica FSC200]